MKLSAKTRYGTRLILDLAERYGEGPERSWEIARRQDISPKFLEQITAVLKKAGLIGSVRGAKGGHYLDRDPAEVTLGQIVRLMEPQTGLTECLFNPDKCERTEDCVAMWAWGQATEALYAKLDELTIEELLKRKSEGGEFEPCGPEED